MLIVTPSATGRVGLCRLSGHEEEMDIHVSARAGTQSEMIYATLNSELASGHFPPGSHLDEKGLCERFGVSRTPVREALLRLAQHGLIHRAPRKGFVVQSLSLDKLLQLFEVGSSLTALAARLSLRRMSGAEFEHLEKLHAEAREILATGDVDKYYLAGHRFHFILIEGSRNDTLIDMVKSFDQRLSPYYRFQMQGSGNMHADFSDHDQMMDSIRKRDEEGFVAMMEKHARIQPDILSDFAAKQRG